MSDKAFITSLGWELLQQKKRKIEGSISEYKQELGDLARGDPGDGFHDSLFLQSQMKVQVLEEQLRQVEGTLANVKVVSEVTQVETVTIGHRVTLKLCYPGEEIEEMIAVILDPVETEVIQYYLSGDEFPISDRSPLGAAICGAKAGNRFQYNIDAGIVEGEILEIEVWDRAFKNADDTN
jgi:transcription elongation GreA/GreB family factor